MSYVYIYSPVSGQIVGIPGAYCSGGYHPFVCSTSPYDITCAGGTALRFSASSLVQSIRTTYYSSGVCYRGSEIPAPWDAKVVVEFFRYPNAQTPIGSVCYAHVNNPVSNGVYPGNQKIIGYAPGLCSCSCNSNQQCVCGGYSQLADQKGYCANQAGLCTEKCPCGCCYKGTHVHFERYGGGETQSLGCWTSVSTSTWVYRWIAPL